MLNITNFYSHPTNSDGLYSECKGCRLSIQREYRKNGNGKKVAKKYHTSEKGQNSFKKFKQSDNYKKNQIKYNKSTKGKKVAFNNYKQYIAKPENKKKRAIYHKNYLNNRYKTDLNFRLIDRMRKSVNRAIKHARINKNNSTFAYIGCSLIEFKAHIEAQFLPGMTWENHNKYGWHIDHIIPLCTAKTEEDIYKLCHYSNLQPLWAKDNLSKGSKIVT